MRLASSLRVSGVVTASVLLACSGSDDGSSAVVAATPQTLQSFAQAYCGKALECTSDVFVKAFYGSVDTCAARVFAQLQLDSRSANYGVSETGAQACRDAFSRTSCTDVLRGSTPSECDFRGSLSDGTSCTADAQCASGSCFVDDAASCGKCGPRAGLDADCTNASCEKSLKCNKAKKCVSGTAGSACTANEDCAGLLTCNEGACTAFLQAGAPCKQGPGSLGCDLTKGLACLGNGDGSGATSCSAVTISFTTVGNECGLKLAPVRVTACENSECIAERCVAHPADGTSCSEGGQKCQEPARCRNGICALKDPALCK